MAESMWAFDWCEGVVAACVCVAAWVVRACVHTFVAESEWDMTAVEPRAATVVYSS